MVLSNRFSVGMKRSGEVVGVTCLADGSIIQPSKFIALSYLLSLPLGKNTITFGTNLPAVNPLVIYPHVTRNPEVYQHPDSDKHCVEGYT